MLNLHATFTKGTVEFRMFEFKDPDGTRKNGLDAGRLRAYVLFCLAVNQKAKDTKRSAPDGRNEGRENTYNRMWSWLYQLGMVEDEFAIVRKVFLNGLVRTPTEHHRNERESA